MFVCRSCSHSWVGKIVGVWAEKAGKIAEAEVGLSAAVGEAVAEQLGRGLAGQHPDHSPEIKKNISKRGKMRIRKFNLPEF